MDTKNSILVVGSIGFDSITSPSGHVDNTLGGSASYFSVAASLYAPVSVVGVVGEDFRDEHFEVMRRHGVNTSGIQIEKGETFRWAGSYVDDLNEAQTLKTELNVFRNFDPVLSEKDRQASFLFLANIDPILQLKVLDQVQSPDFIGLDTMNYWIDSKLPELKKVLSKVDAFLLNETEALKMTGESNIVVAIKKLVTMGPKIVVVKRGEYGFFMYSEGRFFVLPAVPIDHVVDPTGAGDSFAGGFMGYLCQRGVKRDYRALQEACIQGSVVASFCVQDFGLKAISKLTPAQVERRMVDFMQVVSLQAKS
jgi:sugar/nucleoside kinase (ribokinase family)